ncbi:hypothetical protein ALC62_03107 [Cyphomyrmex costatus]|uniref:DUF4817 domain-containing protein n=1 Tax=Cyphomyrmex costatus TaxID=456900 RepID=A0A151IM34_9HYME|nr:hypothetical protein ALC62_03107 [Cyphomyrmex costatus]
MASYTLQEYTDMIIMYGVAGECGFAAARLYAERFPARERHPDAHVILRCVRRFREMGSVLRTGQYAGVRVNIDVADEERILQAFEENPRSSIRGVARALGLSQYAVYITLRRNGQHPYHLQRVQQLLARDIEPRICFCEGLLAQCRRNVLFPDRILWTDEATFTPNGVFNSRNNLFWAEENPHIIRQGGFQYRWSINVWAGVVADRIVSSKRFII